jgi:hypothetical protein
VSYQKCPACDGYGTRPSRKTPGRFVRCRACDRKGVIGCAPAAPPLLPDWLTPMPPISPAYPPLLPYEPTPLHPLPVEPYDPTQPYRITCGPRS